MTRFLGSIQTTSSFNCCICKFPTYPVCCFWTLLYDDLIRKSDIQSLYHTVCMGRCPFAKVLSLLMPFCCNKSFMAPVFQIIPLKGWKKIELFLKALEKTSSSRGNGSHEGLMAENDAENSHGKPHCLCFCNNNESIRGHPCIGEAAWESCFLSPLPYFFMYETCRLLVSILATLLCIQQRDRNSIECNYLTPEVGNDDLTQGLWLLLGWWEKHAMREGKLSVHTSVIPGQWIYAELFKVTLLIGEV